MNSLLGSTRNWITIIELALRLVANYIIIFGGRLIRESPLKSKHLSITLTKKTNVKMVQDITFDGCISISGSYALKKE